MPRKTTLTLGEILKEMPSATGCCCEGFDARKGHPTGLLINEIGHIFWSGEAEAEAAEKKLATLLSDPDEGVRYIAWNFLKTGNHVKLATTATAMRDFENKVDNEHILRRSA